MFPTPQDLIENLKIVFRLFLRREDTTSTFATDNTALAKSFIPALFLFPVFAINMITGAVILDPEVSKLSIGVRALVLYPFYWCLFPVIVHAMGYHENFRTFVVARNWFLVAGFIVALIISLGSIFAFVGSIISLYLAILIKWFLIKDALKVSGGTAIKLWLIDGIAYGIIFAICLSAAGLNVENFLARMNAV